MSSYLTAEQVDVLLRPINPARVSQRDGLSHLEAYDVRAHLNRVFGFGRWSADLIDLTMIYDEPTKTKGGSEAHSVGYRATMRLAVFAPDGTFLASYTEAATGGSVMPSFKRADGHDFAIKTAESQALKRCAINLGDQWGLSLYAAGSREALVRGTLVHPQTAASPTDVQDDVQPVVPETGEEVTAHSAESTSPTTPEVPSFTSVEIPAASPASSPDPVTPQEDRSAQVAQLRSEALEAARLDRSAAMPALGRINLNAGRARLLAEPTRAENGDVVTLGVLIDTLIKNKTRGAA